MRKVISYPAHIRQGIRPLLRGFTRDENLVIIGADTETVFGEPHTVQAFDGRDLLFAYVDGKTVFKVFAEWVMKRARSKGVNLVYIHNLRFDLPVLLFKARLKLYEQGGEFEFDLDGYEVKGLHGKINKLVISDGEGREVTVLDSKAFTQTHFERSLKMFAVPYKKLPKPEGLGTVRLKTPEFEEYAKVDAIAEYHLACRIMDFHAEYGIAPSLSLPQFASRVFRKDFLSPTDHIAFPPLKVVKAAELSYHGGKNGFYLDHATVVEDAYEVDISSAYPHAMTLLPQFLRGDYISVGEFVPGVPGVYRASGHDLGKYPLVFDDNFKPVRGTFKDAWITSFELERALAAKDVEVAVHEGYVWVADPSQTRSPLAEYVRHFYGLKEKTPKSDPSYYFYKIILNALYGKWLQCVESRRVMPKSLDAEQAAEAQAIIQATEGGDKLDYVFDKVLGEFVRVEREWVAGGLFQPFIGSLVTGFVRAYLYDLETKYDAFHSATDAVKTTRKPEDIPGLGGLKVETFGRCYAFRNKLYLHFARDGRYCGHKEPPYKYPDDHAKAGQPLVDHDGQHLCKVGAHGFKGRIYELFDARHALVESGELSYSYDHMTQLREGLKRREAPCAMTKRHEVLKLARRRATISK